ncbi:MAG: hypothetical protein K1Y36_04635 [Blastocatellia bacterium]|nr:hypothetical protein [Blastocatellia bacterium]
MRKLLLLLSIAGCMMLTSVTATQAQNSNTAAQPKAAPTPCKDNPKCREFDFWVGEWNVMGPNGNQVGTNNIQLILDDCVLLENWVGAKGGTGKSFNIYNAPKGQWQQTWVDNTGNVLELSGEFKDGKMQLTGETTSKAQGKQQHRLTFTKLENGNVRQLWEMSSDSGKTWQVAFDGMYVKKK